MGSGESWFRSLLGREDGAARAWRLLAASKAKLLAPMAYPVARTAMVLLTAAGFFVLQLLGARYIGAALTRDVLTLGQAQCLWIVGLAGATFFSGHTAAVVLLDAYAQRRVRLPHDLPPASAQRARNPWVVALQSLCVWGGLAAAVGGVMSRWWSHGVHVTQFAWLFAAASAVLSAGVMLQHTGRRFLDQARLAPERRRFAGSLTVYLWQRHALPQGVVNAVINGFVGAAIAPVALSRGNAIVPASFVHRDAIGTATVLALLIALGVRSYALFESRWGVAPVPRDTATKSAVRASSLRALILVALSAGVLLVLAELPALPVWTFIASRALGCGVLSAIVAYWVARQTVKAAAVIGADRSA